MHWSRSQEDRWKLSWHLKRSHSIQMMAKIIIYSVALCDFPCHLTSCVSFCSLPLNSFTQKERSGFIHAETCGVDMLLLFKCSRTPKQDLSTTRRLTSTIGLLLVLRPLFNVLTSSYFSIYSFRLPYACVCTFTLNSCAHIHRFLQFAQLLLSLYTAHRFYQFSWVQMSSQKPRSQTTSQQTMHHLSRRKIQGCRTCTPQHLREEWMSRRESLNWLLKLQPSFV